MHNFTRNLIVWIVLFVGIEKQAGAQPNLMFEAGATYFTNNVEEGQGYLSDFLAFSINTRINLHARPNSALSLDIPLSIRARFGEETVTRFGFHGPVILTYNIGAGSSGKPSDRTMGYFAGVGWGYFHQQSKSDVDDFTPYNEKLSSFGPAAQFGIRFRLKQVNLWRWNTDRDVHPSVTIKFIYQFDMKDQLHNIAGISIMAGLVF
jgi:hypothetical protein